MLEVTLHLHIPMTEFQWSFVRAGGPGGQNVNKVSSKAVLRWDLVNSPSLPEHVKARLRARHGRRVTTAGEVIVSSQRFRDQEKNKEDCLKKIRTMVRDALVVPKPRKATRPSRGSREARLKEKHRRAATKTGRRRPMED